MLYRTSMPERFWAEVVETTVYTWNRLPNSAIENCTPYERWFNKDFDVNRLKPFGCIVYPSIPHHRLQKGAKLHVHATRGCFMGYTSGYKYWNLEKRQFDSSHNVVFNETESPTSADFNDAPAATPVWPTLPTHAASAPRASWHHGLKIQIRT